MCPFLKIRIRNKSKTSEGESEKVKKGKCEQVKGEEVTRFFPARCVCFIKGGVGVWAALSRPSRSVVRRVLSVSSRPSVLSSVVGPVLSCPSVRPVRSSPFRLATSTLDPLPVLILTASGDFWPTVPRF